MTKWERMNCVGYGASVGETTIAYDIFICKSAKKMSLPRHCIDGNVTSKAVL